MFKQASRAPTQKTTAGAFAGAVTTILVWVVNAFNLLPGGIDIPGEVAAAITTILTFIVSYYIKPAARDVIVPV